MTTKKNFLVSVRLPKGVTPKEMRNHLRKLLWSDEDLYYAIGPMFGIDWSKRIKIRYLADNNLKENENETSEKPNA